MSSDQLNQGPESDAEKRASRNVEPPCGIPRFSCIGCLVVAVIVFLGLCLLLPSIGAPREGGRRSSCLNKAHQLGLAMQNYAVAHNNAFPASAEFLKSSAGTTVSGYSFLVKLLPYMGYDRLYKKLPPDIANGDFDVARAKNADLAAAMDMSLKELTCPSNNNNVFQDPSADHPRFAFTNYKAVGATTRDSLIMAANATAKPPYGARAIHPDGVIFPSDHDLPVASITDGTTHTMCIMETIDDQSSRWMVGNECTLVGLPQKSSPTGAEPAPPYSYFAPPGFKEGEWGDPSPVSLAGLRTFLMYDFSPSGQDVGKYEDPGWSKTPPAYGPSSAHPAVAIVSFADGSMTALSKRCDAANLFFLITKSGQDPFNLP